MINETMLNETMKSLLDATNSYGYYGIAWTGFLICSLLIIFFYDSFIEKKYKKHKDEIGEGF